MYYVISDEYEFAETSYKNVISFAMGMLATRIIANEIYNINKLYHFTDKSFKGTLVNGKMAPDWIGVDGQKKVFLFESKGTCNKNVRKKTKIVAITQVSNVLGRVNPVKEIAAMAHEKNAIVVVDGAQSTPHMPVNVQDLDADFFAFSGHKIFGPMGIGVLYGKKKLLKKMPPFLSGGEMIESVTRESAKYAELPHKFEAGTVNAAGAIALHAAIKYAQSVGFDVMQERELAVTKRAFDGLKELPHVHVLGSDRAEEHTGILTFTIDDVHPHDVSEILIADGICVRAGHHCAQPLLNYLGISSATRASFMFYNTEEEADKFVAGIASIRERMGYGK